MYDNANCILFINMLRIQVRSFSLMKSLIALRVLSQKHTKKSTNEFMTTYQDYVKKKHDDLYCHSSKITPEQKVRAEMVAEEIIKLNSFQFRVLYYLMQDSIKRNFNYKPLDTLGYNTGENLMSQNIWPGSHPTNLKFQKEINEYGLVGYHGFPKEFIDKLLSGKLIKTEETPTKKKS